MLHGAMEGRILLSLYSWLAHNFPVSVFIGSTTRALVEWASWGPILKIISLSIQGYSLSQLLTLSGIMYVFGGKILTENHYYSYFLCRTQVAIGFPPPHILIAVDCYLFSNLSLS